MDDILYDLCIIGAGFFGSTAARHASANPHLKICLIGLDEPSESELASRDIFSSHYDEGRTVKVLLPSPTNQKLAQKSIKRLRHVEELSGIKFYNPVGYMQIGKKGSGVMSSLVDYSASVGLNLLDIPDANLMNKMYPFIKLEDDEYSLLDNNGSGTVSARKMLAAERKVARQQGCQIIFDLVKDVEPLKNYCHEIKTGRHGVIKAKRILFTTGAFTNVNSFKLVPQLEIYVYKEMAAMVRLSREEAERLSSMTSMVYKRDREHIGFYILPPVMYPDGHYYLKVGSMAYDSGKGMQSTEEIKNWFLSKEVPGETESMAKVLFEKLPGLKSEGIFRKVCVTCETPTGFPYIDQINPTVTVAVVGNGWGVCIAEETGRIAAKLSLTGEWDSELPKSLFQIITKND